MTAARYVPRRGRVRPGLTLVELVVALALGGALLGAAVRAHVAQERLHRTLGRALAVDDRVRDAATILPVTLRALSPREGDVPPRAALDTALEHRETVASAVACAAADDWIALPEDDDGVATRGAYLARPEPGDTAWLLAASDSDVVWRPLAIVAVDGGPPCPAPAGATLRVHTAPSPLASGLGAGSAVRVTRRSRWSLYRASDGLWYLGYRTTAAGRLTTVQPVGGPYAASPAPFRYFDAAGVELPAGTDSTTRIARVEVQLRAVDARDPRAPVATARPPADRDPTVASVSITVRNR